MDRCTIGWRQIAPEALLESLRIAQAKGSAPRIPQDNAQATYAPKLTRERGQDRLDRNRRNVIERKIRAFNPWPGAFMHDSTNRKLKIFSAILVDRRRQAGRNFAQRKRADCSAQEKARLSLGEVQLEGKTTNERGRISARTSMADRSRAKRRTAQSGVSLRKRILLSDQSACGGPSPLCAARDDRRVCAFQDATSSV